MAYSQNTDMKCLYEIMPDHTNTMAQYSGNPQPTGSGHILCLLLLQVK